MVLPRYTNPTVTTTMSQILVPESAPFTPEQRAWLNDFFAKNFGEAAPSAKSGPMIPVTILWGSQTGNAEACAKKLTKILKAGNYEPESIDMGQYDRERLSKENNLLIITSTYGDGEPPDNAADLHEFLMGDGVPDLSEVNYSVLALGDTEYPDFCQCGIEFDTQLEKFGAKRLFKRIDCDVDFDDEFAEWKNGVMEAMGGAATALAPDATGVSEDEPYGKAKPFPAPLIKSENLNHEESERQTYHIEIGLEGSGLEYETGDALSVFSQNPAEAVDEILSLLPFNVKDEVPLPGGGEASLREALISHYDIRSLNKTLLTKWQKYSGSPFLRSLIEGGEKADFDEFCWGRELVDLITDHPADFSDGEEFVGVLKKLQPRLYSIASSPKAHPGEVHLTVAIVRYHSHGRERGGVCSTFLSDRAGDILPGVFVHQNKAFRLPEDLSKDVIMVGPGTGIAPFRAFLEEREATEAKGQNWLFFGNPHAATDFIYEEQLTEMQKKGVLNQLSLAFSRDQKEKVYVQDRMIEHGADLWKWLQNGAYFYVCGDASRMAKDVDAALHTIAQEHGGLSEEDAVAYFKNLKKEKRYSRDVY